MRHVALWVKRVVFGFFWIGVMTTKGEIISADRRIIWNPGVPGGIPVYAIAINAKNAPYNSVGDGVHDDTAAIQAALNACPINKAVLLPAGTYKITEQINVRNGTVLRGEGPAKTIIRKSFNNGTGIQIAQESTTAIAASIVNGATKNSTTLTVSNVNQFPVGWYILVDQLNPSWVVKGDCGWASRENGNRAMNQIVKITSKNGNTLTITPSLYQSYTNSPEVFKWLAAAPIQYAGVEDLYIGATTGSEGNLIKIVNAVYCWVKNCELANLQENGLQIRQSYGCEMRGCYVHHSATGDYTGGRAYGVWVFYSGSANLIEDNIFYYLRHSMALEAGGSGNVFAYNFSDRMFDAFYSATDFLMGDMIAHGAHPHMNLFEGNIARIFYLDSIHGSSSHNTAFRNWLLGESQGESDTINWGLASVGIDKDHRLNNVVGNIMGRQGHTGIYNTNRITDIYVRNVYMLGWPSRDQIPSTSPDWNAVNQSTLKHGNYDYITRTIHWDPNVSDTNIPASLYLSDKPTWWGANMPWPPFDPRNPSSATITSIPAGYRFTYGTNPTSSPVESSISLSSNSLAFTAAQGGALTATQMVRIVNGTTTNILSWTQSDNSSWLDVSPSSGLTPGTVFVSANPAGLSAGSYTGKITLAASGASNTPQTITVMLSVSTPLPAISVSPSSRDYGWVVLGSTSDMTFTVRNVGVGTLTGAASVSLPFSIVGNSSYSLVSNASQTITVRYTPSAAGSANQTVTFTGGVGATATVSGSAFVVPTGLSFDATAGAISAPFAINADGTIGQSVETLEPTNGGRAVYVFSITNAGNYIMTANVYAPSDNADSLFVNIDAEPTSPAMVWDIPDYSGFTNQMVTWRGTGGVMPQVWPLDVGAHQLILRGREAGVKILNIAILSQRPAPPKNLRAQ